MEKRDLVKAIVAKHIATAWIEDPSLGMILAPDTIDDIADEIMANEYLWFG